jgi:SapC
MPNLANLDRATHKNLRVQEEQAFGACKEITMCTVMLSEIPRLVIEYPLAFTRHGESGQYICVALFGVDPDRNLYWQGDRWNSVTVPLNVGRQPFFVGMADNPAAGEGAKGLVTCIDLENPGVQTSVGEPLFDADGGETPYLKHKLALLAELLDGEQKTRAFVDRLAALDLLQGIQLELKSPGQAPRKIRGLHAIDENKLRSLDPATLAELHGAGYLHAMYAMLSSLGHLQILARRGAAEPPSASA